MRAVRKRLLLNVVTYTFAAAIVYYAARTVSWSEVLDASRHATIWLFIGASFAGFAIWFCGETILYSRLFSYFHGPTGVRELLPTMASVYFLELFNSYVAGGAFVLFLHARKRAPWLTGGCTLIFQAYLDFTLLLTLSLLAIAIVPTSPIRFGRDYAIVALVGCTLVGSFWLFWGHRLERGNWLRWIYERPSMLSFRVAKPSHYLKLFSIRCLISLGTALALYGQFVSFHIQVPLAQILALTPLVVAIGNSPFSPGGIGTTQLVFTIGFSRFATKSDLFALSLAVSAFSLLVRTPMGLAMKAPLEEIVEVKPEFTTGRVKATTALSGEAGS
jgi:uncharacterized membrane protein YbhN (UPF0104 family)